MNPADRLRAALTRCLRSIAMDCDTALLIELILRGLTGTPPALSASLPYALGDSIRVLGHVGEMTEATALQLLELFQETGALEPLRAAIMLLCFDRMGLSRPTLECGALSPLCERGERAACDAIQQCST